MLPILYSYRRCPYAMRARMALKLAGIDVEIREILLREKPAHMLQVSPKGTVPVLILADGKVIDESLAIMEYALKEYPLQANIHAAPTTSKEMSALVLHNDSSFKQALDGYKYPERHTKRSQKQHRQQGEVFLQQLENLLQQTPYLFAATPSFADYAIFPFIRQFEAVDRAWFDGDNAENMPYPKLRAWLKNWVNSELFISVMQKHPTFKDDK